ncbi:MAG: WG repeat-containing protein [Flavobacteriaceae bacterium]
MKTLKLNIIGILFFFGCIQSFAQNEGVITTTEAEEIEIESIEIYDVEAPASTNVNIYNEKKSAEIITGEIDNTLLVFKGENTDKYGLKNKNNTILVNPIFNSIDTYQSNKNRIVASFNWGETGVMDDKGNIIIPFEYNYINKINDIYSEKGR